MSRAGWNDSMADVPAGQAVSSDNVQIERTHETGSQRGCQFLCEIGQDRETGFVHHALGLCRGAEAAEGRQPQDSGV